jgi:hypothetical protein
MTKTNPPIAPGKAGDADNADVVHFISADRRSGKGNVTACGKQFAYPMRGNGWRVRDISCPDCDRIICDLAHDRLARGGSNEDELIERVSPVRQKHTYGCAAATVAMLLGISYDAAADLLTGGEPDRLNEQGMGWHVPESQLVQHGYAVSRKWRVYQPGNQTREPWPCAPFADLHWCEVIAGPRGAHAVVMLRDGTVLDPMADEPKRLSDYSEVNFIAAVVPVAAYDTDDRIKELRGEILRLVDALVYAHDAGVEWPIDPLPFGSIAHNLFIERGNDPERIEARTALKGDA